MSRELGGPRQQTRPACQCRPHPGTDAVPVDRAIRQPPTVDSGSQRAEQTAVAVTHGKRDQLNAFCEMGCLLARVKGLVLGESEGLLLARVDLYLIVFIRPLFWIICRAVRTEHT